MQPQQHQGGFLPNYGMQYSAMPTLPPPQQQHQHQHQSSAQQQHAQVVYMMAPATSSPGSTGSGMAVSSGHDQHQQQQQQQPLQLQQHAQPRHTVMYDAQGNPHVVELAPPRSQQQQQQQRPQPQPQQQQQQQRMTGSPSPPPYPAGTPPHMGAAYTSQQPHQQHLHFAPPAFTPPPPPPHSAQSSQQHQQPQQQQSLRVNTTTSAHSAAPSLTSSSFPHPQHHHHQQQQQQQPGASGSSPSMSNPRAVTGSPQQSQPQWHGPGSTSGLGAPMSATTNNTNSGGGAGGTDRDKHYWSNHPFEGGDEFESCSDAPPNRTLFAADNLPERARTRPRTMRKPPTAPATADEDVKRHTISVPPFQRNPHNGSITATSSLVSNAPAGTPAPASGSMLRITTSPARTGPPMAVGSESLQQEDAHVGLTGTGTATTATTTTSSTFAPSQSSGPVQNTTEAAVGRPAQADEDRFGMSGGSGAGFAALDFGFTFTTEQ